jgi:hypothetical protein
MAFITFSGSGFNDSAVRKTMESISNLQPLLPSKEAASLLRRAFASFGGEIDQLIEMTRNEKLPVANLGSKAIGRPDPSRWAG